MFRRLRWFIGRNWSTKRLANADLSNPKPPSPPPPPPPPPPMTSVTEVPVVSAAAPPVALDAVHEVAIYLHRFHNLDLFQQG